LGKRPGRCSAFSGREIKSERGREQRGSAQDRGAVRDGRGWRAAQWASCAMRGSNLRTGCATGRVSDGREQLSRTTHASLAGASSTDESVRSEVWRAVSGQTDRCLHGSIIVI
jgi:hypothetical protein